MCASLKYVEDWETLRIDSKCVKVGQRMSECVKLCQTASKCIKVCESMSKRVKACQSVSKCIKVCQRPTYLKRQSPKEQSSWHWRFGSQRESFFWWAPVSPPFCLSFEPSRRGQQYLKAFPTCILPRVYTWAIIIACVCRLLLLV